VKVRLLGGLAVALMLAGSAVWVKAALESPHGRLKQDCSACHTPEGWSQRPDPTFRHDRDTGWPLEGGHAGLACASCHTDLRFQDAEATCAACHLDTHQGSLGDDCATCHGPTQWLDEARLRRFHDQSLFPLTGAHATATCASCHKGGGAGQFAGTSATCLACHAQEWQATTAPSHQEGGLGTDCATCHGTRRWTDTPGFAHNDFPLTGAHRGVTCVACHVNGQFSGTPGDCWSCHQGDWSAALNPDHQTGQYPQTCAVCHSTSAWRPSAINHSLTDFPLTGAHVGVSCAACHTGGQYNGTPSSCWACHEPDWAGAENPNHLAGNYPQTCDQCHSTGAWRPASFDHGATDFPLTGAHTGVSCSACHQNGQYTGLESTCQSCHLDEWQGTSNPDHAAADFPMDCTLCHSTTRWTGAVFNHDQPWFPIYSGSHRGTWTSCAECHTQAEDYTSFSCLGCHEHNRSDMDGEHNDVGNYRYISAACLECHPNGSENDQFKPGQRLHRQQLRLEGPSR